MTEHDDTTATSGISRRSLVKTGAHAAWAVPVVIAVSSAPAFADGSGMNVPLIVSITTATRSESKGGNAVLVIGTITNPAGGQTTDNITFNVNLQPSDPAGDFSTSTPSGAAGFSLGDVTPQGKNINVQYRRTGSAEVAPGETVTFRANFMLKPTTGPGTAFLTTVEALPDGMGGGTITDTAQDSKTFD